MDRKRRDERFRTFFLEEGERLRRLAIFLTGDVEGAGDLAQEALARLYKYWGRVRNDDPGPYVRRILVNLVRSKHRRKVLDRRHLQVVGSEEASPAPRIAEAMRVAEALSALSPIRRATIVLRFYEDMSESQIAATLERPLGTVKSDIHRGLAQLQSLLEDRELA